MIHFLHYSLYCSALILRRFLPEAMTHQIFQARGPEALYNNLIIFTTAKPGALFLKQ